MSSPFPFCIAYILDYVCHSGSLPNDGVMDSFSLTLSNFLSIACWLVSSFFTNAFVRDHVWHPYVIAGKTLVKDLRELTPLSIFVHTHSYACVWTHACTYSLSHNRCDMFTCRSCIWKCARTSLIKVLLIQVWFSCAYKYSLCFCFWMLIVVVIVAVWVCSQAVLPFAIPRTSPTPAASCITSIREPGFIFMSHSVIAFHDGILWTCIHLCYSIILRIFQDVSSCDITLLIC